MVVIGFDVIRDFYGNFVIFSGCVVFSGMGLNCKDDVWFWDVKLINEVFELVLWFILSLGFVVFGV